MIIFRNTDEIKDIERTAVALGNFDGIHRGHQALINKAVEIAKKKGIKSAVFTFSNHPRNVMSGRNVVKNIIYEDEKIEILESMGVDYLFNLDFDEKMMRQTPESFVRDLLMGVFHIDTAVCGFNFTYGHRAAGTAGTLKSEETAGFDVCVLDAVTADGRVVSSTLIREMIEAGDVRTAGELLGRPYSIRGAIVHGNELGRTIGFPTCNIVIDESMVTPCNGVYVTRSSVGGRRYESVTNVGNKPTVGIYGKNIETNLFDFDSDVYGEEMQVEFLEKIRDERKFANVDELSAQIKRDRDFAREFHSASDSHESGRPAAVVRA